LMRDGRPHPDPQGAAVRVFNPSGLPPLDHCVGTCNPYGR